MQSMTLNDFSDGVNFVKNATEFGLLDDEAKAAITAHHSKLVSGNYIEEERSPFNHRRNTLLSN